MCYVCQGRGGRHEEVKFFSLGRWHTYIRWVKCVVCLVRKAA